MVYLTNPTNWGAPHPSAIGFNVHTLMPQYLLPSRQLRGGAYFFLPGLKAGDSFLPFRYH